MQTCKRSQGHEGDHDHWGTSQNAALGIIILAAIGFVIWWVYTFINGLLSGGLDLWTIIALVMFAVSLLFRLFGGRRKDDK